MMQHSKKALVTLTVLAMALLMQPRAECYAQGWSKVGKKLVESFMKQFGKVATEVSVRVLADQLTKQIDKHDGKTRENEYVYIQLIWNFYGHQHVGVLTLGENGGFFRVAFFNSQRGVIEAVDQNLSVREKNGNVYLEGDTPRYAGTNIKHPTYLPDILLLQCDYSGRWRVAQIGDSQGYWVPVYQYRLDRSFVNRYPQLLR